MENGHYVDEQNGFRAKRSCADHIFVLTSILRNRKARGLSTYVAFIDAEKAFDKVDRNLLLYKLLLCGVNGSMYSALKNVYRDSMNCVSVNGWLTDWFPTLQGVKQGDTISPTLFGIYINDLVREINNEGCGINIGNRSVSCLLFADDLALISDSEENLQRMLNTLNTWCNKEVET